MTSRPVTTLGTGKPGRPPLVKNVATRALADMIGTIVAGEGPAASRTTKRARRRLSELLVCSLADHGLIIVPKAFVREMAVFAGEELP